MLIAHFGVPKRSDAGVFQDRIIDGARARSEWVTFKFELKQLKNEGYSLEGAYRLLLSRPGCPNVKILAAISLVLCLSTVWCERGFSLMAVIKTKLRNCLNSETLDALMMIASNGPLMKDHAAVATLIDEAYEHWRSVHKRQISKSHPGVKRTRTNTKSTMSLCDLLEEQAKEARAAVRCDIRLAEDDEEDDEDEEKEEVDEAAAGAQVTTEAIRASHGVYTPPVGWQIFPAPCRTEGEWATEMKKMKKGSAFWRGKRLAHVFDDGWDEGTFQGRTGKHLVFFYKSVPMKYGHSLDFEEFGVAKSWVIIGEAA
jgi:hypothetical protein